MLPGLLGPSPHRMGLIMFGVGEHQPADGTSLGACKVIKASNTSGGVSWATPAVEREDEDKFWHGMGTMGSTNGDSLALKVAEIQQVELPAVLTVVDVVHVLLGWMDTWIRLSTWSWGGLGCPVSLEVSEPLGTLPWEPLAQSLSLKPPSRCCGWQGRCPKLLGWLGGSWNTFAGTGQQKAKHHQAGGNDGVGRGGLESASQRKRRTFSG